MLCSEDFLKLSHLCNLLTINICDNITILKTCILSSTTISNLIYIDTFVSAKVNLLLLCLLTIKIATNISSLNTEHTTLYLTVFLQISNNLIHDCCRDSETIACEVTCLRVEHCVDTNKLTLHVYESTTRVTCIDSSISLDECLYTICTK